MLQVVILAAAQGALLDAATPRPLLQLGGRAIIDYVVEWARALTAPEYITVVVGQRRDDVIAHLGPDLRYVVQEEQLGTGHALQQAWPLLSEYEGDLLVLYGDTPLFRLSSLRGLVNLHRQSAADLTLFACQTQLDLPYGRIVRYQGEVVHVVEADDADAAQLGIRELNLGAYVAQSSALFAALRAAEQRETPQRLRLTSAVKPLHEAGGRVACYSTLDEDEVLGINSLADLRQAELILKKRALRPRRLEEENVIRFGTGGWRAIIAEGFTFYNVRRLSQALANRLIRQGQQREGVVIGGDRRFLSDEAAVAAAEVLAGNGVYVRLLPEAAPTPLITFATAITPASYGLAFTASHNPPEWNGLKVFRHDGALLLDAESAAIEEEANRLTPDEVIKIELPIAKAAGKVEVVDYLNAYVDSILAQVDTMAIRNANLRLLLDPMFGVGEPAIDIVLTSARCRVASIHGRHDPLFGGRSPAPDLDALGLLRHEMREGHYDLGLATDGDADRIALVDEQGEYIPMNDLLLLIYWYLHEVRGQKGAVVRNLATTHMLDRLAALLGESCIEVPVGFKHVVDAMLAHDAILGGESSGGLTIRGHILGKDGVLSAALIVEMLARTGERISTLLERLYAQVGRMYAVERNLPATPEMRILFPSLLAQHQVATLADLPVQSLDTSDGFKFRVPGDQWVLIRFSGTEPILRIFSEGNSKEEARALADAAQALLPT
jgi:phosphomannomutase/GTP:adenosylcobinamide-phosphate guanylyltransferase